MEHLFAPLELRQDETRESPGRLTGVLLRYEERAGDRAEMFTRGSLYWPPEGVIVNQQHNRQMLITRVIPFLDGDEVRIDVALPNTTAGRDAATNVREGILTGLSVEFQSEKEGRRNGLRIINRARLGGMGLVDSSSYKGSTVEVRSESGLILPRAESLWL